jgi:hypothetical protein
VKNNMKKKNIGICAITLIIAGLMIMASATTIGQNPKTEEKTLRLESIGKCIVGMEKIDSKTLTKVRPSSSFDGTPLYLGINPTIASDVSNIVLGLESVDDPNCWFTGSIDGGQSWAESAVGWALDEPPELPDIDSCGDGRFMGTMVPSYLDGDGGNLYKVRVTDVGDLENGYTCSYWTFGDLGEGYTNFVCNGAAGYTAEDPAENEWAFGVVTMQGDYADAGPQPLMSYQFDDTGYAWIYTFGGDINGGESTKVDIDQETLYMYGVWNYYDSELEQNDILIEIMDFGTWDDYEGYVIHPEIGGYTLSTDGSDDFVDISAQSDNVIIVSERSGDIVAYSSSDGFQSDLVEFTIASGAKEPRIVHTDENTAMCTFIMDDSVYSSITDNGGGTWSTPVMVSGPGEDVERADVCGFGTAYESEETIYFAFGGGEFPIIGIDSISGGIGVSAVIKNTGTGDAIDLPYSITVSGGILGMINKEDSNTISIPADGEATVKLPMILGLGKVSITVTAGSASETVEGTQILVYTMI